MKLQTLHEFLAESGFSERIKAKMNKIAGGDAMQAWKAPTTFKKGDKFEITSNGRSVTVEVIDASHAPQELKIATTNKSGRVKETFTDSIELSQRLRYCEKYEKL